MAERGGGPPDAPQPATRASASGPRAWLERYAVVLLTIALAAVLSLTMSTFRTSGNFEAMVNSQAIVLLLGLAACIVLRTGDFDFSISSMMVASAAVVSVLSTETGVSPVIAILAALALGVVVGLVHAFLVVIVGVDSLITTLGSMSLLTGLAYAITNSHVIVVVPDSITNIARPDIFGLPALTWYGWALVLVVMYVFEYTPLGRYMLFIGGNRDAARLAGLRVRRIRMGAFVVSGLLSAATGVLLASQLGAIDPSIGGSYLLAPFSAAFLGATTIKLGRFNALGTLVALYLLTVGITGLQLAGAPQWVTLVFNGGALIIAVTLARLARGREA
jgi:ribose transport system permease protein